MVRHAVEGEKFTTLDGKERTLTNRMLLIADETKAVALAPCGWAWCWGGSPLPTFCWKAPASNRRIFAPRQRSLSCARIPLINTERGADVSVCELASRRGAGLLICDTAGGI